MTTIAVPMRVRCRRPWLRGLLLLCVALPRRWWRPWGQVVLRLEGWQVQIGGGPWRGFTLMLPPDWPGDEDDDDPGGRPCPPWRTLPAR